MAHCKDHKHAIHYEQTNHAFFSLVADTYNKLSDDFVRFIWMVANSAAAASSCPSQPNSAIATPSTQANTFARSKGSSFSHMRVQIGAAIAKAAAVRFLSRSTNDGLPLPTYWDRRSPGKVAPFPDLPLYHAPC